MRWRPIAALTVVLVASSCRDEPAPTSSSVAAVTGMEVQASGGSECPTCVFGPKTLTRIDGVRFAEVRQVFRADPAASYLLVARVTTPASRVQVFIDGVLVVSLAESEAARGADISKAVVLKDENRLTMQVYGPVGSSGTVSVMGGVGSLGVQGGRIVVPGSKAFVSLSSNALTGKLGVSAYDDTSTSVRYFFVGKAPVRLTLDVADTTLRFGTGVLTIGIPLREAIPAGHQGVMRASVTGMSEDVMASASVVNGALVTAIPVADLMDIKTFLSASRVTLTLSAEAIPAIPSSTAPTQPRVRGNASTAFVSSSLVHSCDYGSSSETYYITSSRAIIPCDQLPLLAPLVRHGTGGTAIVLIHGWDRKAVSFFDVYESQGLRCAIRSTLTPQGRRPIPGVFDCDDQASADPWFPSGDYFQYSNPTNRPSGGSGLLPEVVNAFPTTSVYQFSYPTFLNIATNGQALGRALRALSGQPGAPTRFILVGHSMGGLIAREAAPSTADLLAGIITLGTAHLGTPAVTHNFLNFFLAPGAFLPGGQDLQPGVSRSTLPPGVQMIAYAGRLNWIRSNCTAVRCTITEPPQQGHDKHLVGPIGIVQGAGAVLCRLDNECESDGVVPYASAYWSAGATTSREMVAFDHTQMHAGGTAAPPTDALHLQIINDIQQWLGTAPAPKVLFSQPYYGSAFSVAGANPSAMRYMYSPFSPLGTTQVFPTSQFYTLTAEVKTLRVRRVAGVACNVPSNITLFTDLGNPLGTGVGSGVPAGVDYCDFPVHGTSTGNRFSGIAFCVNSSCNNTQGDLVLSGASINAGGIFTGSNNNPAAGGPAFQLCGAGGCDDSFIFFPGGTPPTISLSANPVTVSPGQSTLLSWSAIGATKCSAPWTSSAAAVGSQAVNPTVSTTYTLVCSGTGGASLATVTANVAAMPTWTPVAQLPSPLAGSATIGFNGGIHVVGGSTNGLVGNQHYYDPATDTWQGKRALPSPFGNIGWGLGNGSASVLNGLLHLVGGVSGGGNGIARPVPTHFAYDVNLDSWSYLADLPTAGIAVSGEIGGRLFALVNTGTAALFYSYDPVTNTWRSEPNLPAGRIPTGGGAINGKFYAVGGVDNGVTSAKLDVYDPTTGTWSAGPPMQAARDAFGSTGAGGKLYVAGGRDATGSIGSVESFNPTTNRWTSYPPLPSGSVRSGLGIAVVGYKLYAVGGSCGVCFPPALRNVEVLDLSVLP